MQYLSKRDFYVQLKTEFIRSTLNSNLENIRFKALALIVCFVSMFSLLFQAQPVKAQAAARDYSEIKIGQKLPSDFWQKVHSFYSNGNMTFNTLSRFKDKVIIIDFWATWCKSCIEGFPKAEEMKRKFPDIVWILVNSKSTKDNYKRIQNTLSSYADEYKKSINLPVIIDDDYLEILFPHTGLPHLIILGKDGRLITATYAEEVNSQNLTKFIKEGKKSFHVKNDFIEESKRIEETDSLLIFSSTFSKYTEGLGNKTPTLTERGNNLVYSISNYDLSTFFIAAYQKEKLVNVPKTNWIFEKNISQDIVRKFVLPRRYKDEYCYELIFDKDLSSVNKEGILKKDLLNIFGLKVDIIKKDMEVFILMPTKRLDKHLSKSNKSIWQSSPEDSPKIARKISLKTIIDKFGVLLRNPVFLDVNEDIKVDLDLPDDIFSFNREQLIGYLQDVGLSVTKANKPIEVAVFSTMDTNINY